MHAVRGQTVPRDRDLAALHGVSSGALNQAVRRNARRFPPDFAFRLTAREEHGLISRIVMSNGRGGRRHRPRVFTEQGAAMLSSVVRSPRAIAVHVAIMRGLRAAARPAADPTRASPGGPPRSSGSTTGGSGRCFASSTS